MPDSIETNRKKGSKLHSQRVTPRPGLALGDRSRAGQSRKWPRVPIDQLPGGDEFAELRGDDFAGDEVLRRLQVDEGRWQPQSNPVLRPYSSGQKGNPDKVLEGIRGEGCTVMRASPDHKRGGFAGSLKRHARDRIDLFLKRAGPSLMVAEQAIALEGVDEPDALNTGSHRTIDPDDCGWSVLAGESRRGKT